MLRGKQKNEKQSCAVITHEGGAHARRRFTPMYTLRGAAAHTHTQESHGSSSNKRRGSHNNITTIIIIIHEAFSACRQNPGLEEGEEEEQQQQDARTTGLLRRDPPLVSRTQQRQGGEKKKNNKNENSARQPQASSSRNRTSAVAQRISFHPTALVVGAGTSHTTPAQYESTRAHEGCAFVPPSRDGAGQGDKCVSKKVTTTQWALPPSRWALGGLGEQLLQQALPLVAARLVVDPWCRLRRWGVRGWQQWEQG